jgi:hypothetical protein
MTQPLFATYSTDENRVSGSLMAVFERLPLTTLQRLLSEATEEDVPLVEFRTQPRNPHGPGVPDGAITASVLYLVEAKVKPDTVGLRQLERHLAWLDGSSASHGRLYVLTPDRGKPPVLEAFAEDERVVWLSYLALDDAIASVLELPIDEVTERERFLLRELANMFRQEGLVGGFDTVVVAGRISWPEYLEFGIYACQAQRAFRDVPYLGFYADGEIKPLLARRLAWWPEIRFDAETAALPKRMRTRSSNVWAKRSLRSSGRPSAAPARPSASCSSRHPMTSPRFASNLSVMSDGARGPRPSATPRANSCSVGPSTRPSWMHGNRNVVSGRGTPLSLATLRVGRRRFVTESAIESSSQVGSPGSMASAPATDRCRRPSISN